MAPKRKAGTPAAGDKSTRKLRKLDTEQTAEKAIKDNCRGWPSEQTHVQQNKDGMTLFQVVLADIRRKRKDSSFIMGAIRWRQVRAMFRPETDPSGQLRLPEPPQAFPPKLLRVVAAARRVRRDYTPFSLYLASASAPNETTLVGILRQALTMNPRQAKALTACQDVLKYVARLGLEEKWPQQIEVMLPWFDSVLCISFEKSGLQPLAWLGLQENMACARLLLPRADVEALEACGDQYHLVKQELNRLVASSTIGTQLFSFAIVKCLSDSVQSKIDEHIKVLHAGELARGQVDNLKAETLQAVEAMPSINLLAPRRVVDVLYRGQRLKGKVNSLPQHVSLCVAAAWKSRAVLEGSIPETWCEPLIFGDVEINAVLKPACHHDLVGACAAARCELRRQYSELDQLAGPALMTSLGSLFPRFYATDGEFAVEQLLIEACLGDGAAARLQARVLTILPSGSTHNSSPEEALQNLTILTNQALFRMAAKSAQAQVQLAIKWTSRIVEGQPLKLEEGLKDDHMTAVIQRLEFFCSFSQAASSGKAAKKLFKVDALKARIAWLESRAAEGLALSDLEPLHVWAHLLPPTLGTKAKQLQKSLTEKVTSIREMKKAKASKGGTDSAMSEAMALFTK